MYLAVGIDQKHAHIFIQSEVLEHAELAWILSTITKVSELERMTQYKDKTKDGKQNAETGLFTYPILMAADILLYGTTIVPVGEDQVQHLELTRVLARKFNTVFGETFAIPRPLVQKSGARIMSLDNPTNKMSKSSSSKWNALFLTDDANTIRQKIAHAVTDSGKDILFDPVHKPALANLITIYHHATGASIQEIETTFEGKGYGDFKTMLTDVLIQLLQPIQQRFKELISHPDALSRILDQGRDYAMQRAHEQMKIVRERIGIGR
jgi:tryptophanyl-tRNA synthetase